MSSVRATMALSVASGMLSVRLLRRSSWASSASLSALFSSLSAAISRKMASKMLIPSGRCSLILSGFVVIMSVPFLEERCEKLVPGTDCSSVHRLDVIKVQKCPVHLLLDARVARLDEKLLADDLEFGREDGE